MAMVEKKNGKSNYFKDVGKELKKVNYPSVSQVRRNTLIVIVLSIIVGIFIAILDFTFGSGATWLLDQNAAATVTATPAPGSDGFVRDENGNITGIYDQNGNIVPITQGSASPDSNSTDNTSTDGTTTDNGGQ